MAKRKRLQNPLIVLGSGIGLAIITDLMLYQQFMGISFPIIVILFLTGLFVLTRTEERTISPANLWLVIPILFLAVMSIVRAAPLLRFLNIAGTLTLLLLLTNRLLKNPVIELNIGDYIIELFEAGLMAGLNAIEVLTISGKAVASSENNETRTLSRVVVGLLIALPFLCIFTLLFASADLLFGKIVNDTLEAFNINDIFGHLILTAFFAWIIVGAWGYTLTQRFEDKNVFISTSMKLLPDDGETDETSEVESPPEEAAPTLKTKPAFLGLIEAMVALISLDLLFLFFVGVQFAALFGGESFLQTQGITYSEYARSGFFQLVAVAVIVQGIILTIEHVTRRETPQHKTLFLAGVAPMVVMTVFILISAFMRLALYEAEFGFTRLRVHSHVAIIWIGLLLIVFLFLLFTERIRIFATVIMIAMIGFTTTLNFLNPDAFIVRQNVKRYQSGQELDVRYLGSLSQDAMPDFVALLITGIDDPELNDQAGTRLYYQYLGLAQHQRKGWTSFHLSYTRAFHALDAHKEIIRDYNPDR